MNKLHEIDPNLDTAQKEIEDILDKYEMGACMILSTKDAGLKTLYLPNWSVAKVERNSEGDQIGIRFSFNRNQKDLILQTLQMISWLTKATIDMEQGLIKVAQELQREFGKRMNTVRESTRKH